MKTGIYANAIDQRSFVNPIVWIKATDLQSSLTDGESVLTWPSHIMGLPNAVSAADGGAPMPIFKTSGDHKSFYPKIGKRFMCRCISVCQIY